MEEVVVIDTGVDPSGVDPAVGGRRKKAKDIKFAKRKNVCLMQRVTGTQFGVSFCGST